MSGKTIFNLVLILVALGLIFLGYRFLTTPDEAAFSEEGLTAEGDVTQSISDEFLATLTGLQELNLRGEIFQDPVFRALVDSPLVLKEQTPGRPNPFAPVDFDRLRAVGATSASTSTGALGRPR